MVAARLIEKKAAARVLKCIHAAAFLQYQKFFRFADYFAFSHASAISSIVTSYDLRSEGIGRNSQFE